MEIKGKNILVLGMGLSGRSAARFLQENGGHVTAIDKNDSLLATKEIQHFLQKGGTFLNENDPLNVGYFDFIVASPGISPQHKYYSEAIKQGIEVLGEVELAFRFLPQNVLAITGTNGKTTTTLLVAHVLNYWGKKALALGNVGVPLIEQIQENRSFQDIFVVELSSFQLDTLSTKKIQAGAILNITPDHLDRYSSMQEYAKSKFHLKDCLKPGGKLFIEQKCYAQFGSLLGDIKPYIYGYNKNCDIYFDKKDIFFNGEIAYILPEERKGKASHDIENEMAAFCLCQEFGITGKQFSEAVATFEKPPHRIEFVKKKNGIAFYNDSKGTNIDAVIRAVESLDGEIFLIAGGVDKGAAYTPWIEAFANKVKCICAIGQASEKIENDLGKKILIKKFNSLEDAIKHAAELAAPGQNVLLSPGCSSYDMWKDYKHRGNEFKRIVHSL